MVCKLFLIDLTSPCFILVMLILWYSVRSIRFPSQLPTPYNAVSDNPKPPPNHTKSTLGQVLTSLILKEECCENTYALTQPSFSQLFVICAHRPQTTFPPAVTNPNSLTLTSIIVPFVRTPNCVYMGFCGFFLTEIIGS